MHQRYQKNTILKTPAINNNQALIQGAGVTSKICVAVSSHNYQCKPVNL